MRSSNGTEGRARWRLRVYQAVLLALLLAAWYVLTSPTLLPPFYFSNPKQAAFLFGEPLEVAGRLWKWFASGEIYIHLWVTLVETLLAFAIGTILGVIFGLWLALSPTASAIFEPYITAANAMPRVILAPVFFIWFGLDIGSKVALGVIFGLWLALSPTASAIFDPYITAANAMPRVILAPIFFIWFGLDIGSKVALGVTLVFFIVFFNVYQGVREVSPVVLANARMLGATRRQLLRHVYLPSAMSWVFASLHNSVGLAFVGAVVGEYLGSARGVGYLILQAEGVFDMNTVVAGVLLLTVFALILDGLVGLAERRLMVWQPRSGETERV